MVGAGQPERRDQPVAPGQGQVVGPEQGEEKVGQDGPGLGSLRCGHLPPWFDIDMMMS